MHPLVGNRTFLRLLVGRLVTNAGDSIYYVAALWLVHDLANSTVYTGIASFMFLLPGTLQFVVGPLVDRFSVRWVLVWTQAGQGILVGTIPVAAWFGHLSVALVLVVIPLASLLNQVTYPAQSSALPRTVEEDHLSTANSVFNAAHEGVNLTFNAVGGILVGIAAVGAVGALVLDVGTFAVAIVLFAGLSLPARNSRDEDPSEADGSVRQSRDEESADAEGSTHQSHDEESARQSHDEESANAERSGWGSAGSDSTEIEDSAQSASMVEQVRAETRSYVADFTDGLGYLRGSTFLAVVLPQIVVSFAMGMLLAILPAYAALRGGSGLYGVLLSALAAGALVGSLVAARLDTVPYGYLIAAGSGVTALSWAVAAMATWTPLIVVCFAAAIVYSGGNRVLFDTLVQTVVPEALIGRITSTMATLTNVATPFGSLAGGGIAALVGPAPILLIAAAANALVMGYFLVSPRIRSLPPVADVERGDPRIEQFGGSGDD